MRAPPCRAGSRLPDRGPLRAWAATLRHGLLILGLIALLTLAPLSAAAAPLQEAVFAGGCFWCLEHDLEVQSGVVEAISGYSGGRLERPTYAQVSAGGTGHQEAVLVRFDPAQLSYAALLRHYWRQIDPLDAGGQFCDRGDSYRPVIFPRGSEQELQARQSLESAASELAVPVSALKVAIQPLDRFWPAEGYHQNYAERQAIQYTYYRWACGRDRRLDAVWGPRARSGVPWTAGPAPGP
ncbi:MULTISPECIES: peptide-methionine (S)-S-oxide reductase MsrA [Aphanothece]|uniref:peptide-methionine (S)-S-oxide reductase MsrA n=1 Tax=Aphanothece TaxID=1121 RepID=UPI003985511D